MAFESFESSSPKFFPSHVEDKLVAMVGRAMGVGLFALLVFIWLALATWTTTDPSLTLAISGPVQNAAGAPGAILADLLLQTLGLASVALLLAPMFWSLALIKQTQVHNFRTRAAYYPLSILAVAGALSALPETSGWPVNHGLGGILGDVVFGLIVEVFAVFNQARAGAATGLLLAAIAVSTVMHSLGLELRDLQRILFQPIKTVKWRETAGTWHTTLLAEAKRVRDSVRDVKLSDAGDGVQSPSTGKNVNKDFTLSVDGPVRAAPQIILNEQHNDEVADDGLRAPSLPFHVPSAQGSADWKPAPPRAFDNSRRDKHSKRHDSSSSAAAEQPQRNHAWLRPLAPHPMAAPLSERAPVEPRQTAAPTGYNQPVIPHHVAATRQQQATLPQPIAEHPGRAEFLRVFGPSNLVAKPASGAIGQSSPQAEAPSWAPVPAMLAVAGDEFDETSLAIARRFAPERPTTSDEYRSDGDDKGDVRQTVLADVVPAPQQSPPQQVLQPAAMPSMLRQRPSLQTQSRARYILPSTKLLKRAEPAQLSRDQTPAVLHKRAEDLQSVLSDFGVQGEIKNIRPGPVVTLFEFEPARGIKSSRVIGLADDIARSMSAISARVAVVPGRNVIGIELPNEKRRSVLLRELLDSNSYRSAGGVLPLTLGKAIGGEPVVADLARMPHLLVAGTTGSGKSVGVNAMVLSILFKHTPETCRFLMIDPKMLELSVYNDIPHLLSPVITDPEKAVVALNWAVREMEERYKRMSKLSVRNIGVYNNRVRNAKKHGERVSRTVHTGFDSAGHAIYEQQDMAVEELPHIVIVVDEFADLMMVAGKEIEAAIQRLAQMARAAGIHLIMATQRPSVDVITGTIKANFPTRISFKVTSKVDSRTILNEQGAEQLLGQGDMLYASGSGQTVRVHGPFVSDEEVEAIANHLKTQGTPAYVAAVTESPEPDDSGPEAAAGSNTDLYEQAVAIVLRDGKASTSYVQRRLSIGYNRAADLIERMEEAGVIGPAGAGGKREILGHRGRLAETGSAA